MARRYERGVFQIRGGQEWIEMVVPLKTRAEAKEQGAKFYQTNNPCKRNHRAKRRTSNAGCVECKFEDYQRRLGPEGCTERSLASRAELLRIARKNDPKYKEYQKNRSKDRLTNPQLRTDRRPPWLGRVERDEMMALYQSAKRRGLVVDHLIPFNPPEGGIVGVHKLSNLDVCTPLVNGKKGRRLELTDQEELDAIAEGNAVRREDAAQGKQVNWQPYIRETLAPLFELIAAEMPPTWTVAKLINRAADVPSLAYLIKSICGEPIRPAYLSNFLARNAGLVSGGRAVTLDRTEKRYRIWRIDCVPS